MFSKTDGDIYALAIIRNKYAAFHTIVEVGMTQDNQVIFKILVSYQIFLIKIREKTETWKYTDFEILRWKYW